MQRIIRKATTFFEIPLDLRSRVVILVGAALLTPVFVLPLWQVDFQSDRYPQGLMLKIYSHTLEEGKPGDLLEINALNHYLGMKPLEPEEISQFRWFPFLLGVCFLLALRTAVLGTMSRLVDLFVLAVYLGLFTLWSFHTTLSKFGQSLNPFATVRVEPFTPPLVGEINVAHVLIKSGPEAGAFLLVIVPLAWLAAVVLSWKTWSAENQPGPDYIS
ncbi:MAG: hypothetical protein HY563_08390 [Ignavibacteriales bacterium]|jgi:copper chaperone NosL|nr:hypothetical protein [Ignavibacteriales bacterium]